MTSGEGVADQAAPGPGPGAVPEDQDHPAPAPAAAGRALGEPSAANLAYADGVAYVNRAGVAELASRSLPWVEKIARAGQRASTGFPAPVPGVAPARNVGVGRQQVWYPLDQVRAWLSEWSAAMPEGTDERPASRRGGRPPAGSRPPLPAPEPEDPDALIGETWFREKIAQPPISGSRWRRMREQSVPEWQAGRDGILPMPDGEAQVTNGQGTSTVYKWTAGKAVAWQNERVAEHRRRHGDSP